MNERTNYEEKIAAYLRTLNELERIEEQHAIDEIVPTSSKRAYSWVIDLILLRLKEFHWTISRALRKSQGWLFPDYVARKYDVPVWRATKRPAVSPEGRLLSNPRLLIDMTSTLRSGKRTGIQRVVREIARHAWEIGAGIPVAIHNGRLFSYYPHADVQDVIGIADGDIFLLLDASWNHTEEYIPILDEVEARGGRSIVCVYDILPLLYPTAFSEDLSARFRDWFGRIVLKSNGIVADSRAVAEDLRNYLLSGGLAAEELPIGWWHLGADFSPMTMDKPSEQAKRIASDVKPYFLGVGTVEPRKGYPIVLDALEHLWSEGIDFTYVIVGDQGWGMRHFEKRLRCHPEFGQRLFWLQRAGDSDLALLYSHTRSLIIASVAEGFGLPIVEAANYGAPVIATDLPVFHEVVGDSAQYFSLLDANELATQMRAALAEKPAAPVIPRMNWRESAQQLVAVVRENGFQRSLTGHVLRSRPC